jgi:hypothetical protein
MLSPAWGFFRKFSGFPRRWLKSLRRYESDPFTGNEELSDGKIVEDVRGGAANLSRDS